MKLPQVWKTIVFTLQAMNDSNIVIITNIIKK